MRGYIIVDYGRREYRSKETRQFSACNIVETVGGDCRGGYMFQNSHYSSRNPVYHSRLLHIPGASSNADNILHENERVYIRIDGSDLAVGLKRSSTLPFKMM